MPWFSTELDPRGLPATLSAFTAIVPWSVWKRRVESLRSELLRNPLWEEFLRDRHALELALADVRQYQRSTRRWPWPPRTAEEYRLASFIGVAVRVYANLGRPGKARLAGAIRSALEKEAGLGPLAHEMKVITHLMSRGFDVSFNDLENGGGFDLLARCDSTEVEVECKYVSADIGRQIHRRKIYEFGGLVYPLLSRALDHSHVGRLVRVTLPGRLTGSRQQHEAIAGRISMALAGILDGDTSVCGVRVDEFEIAGSIFSSQRGDELTLDDVGLYVSQVFGLEEAHMLANWRPGHAAVIVHFESEVPDRVLDEIFKHLKDDARRQFSGARPAFMCVHLADVTRHQLLELARTEHAGTVTGIQRAISTLLNRRVHLHSVALMTDGVVSTEPGNRRTRAVQEAGPSYVFSNPDHPDAHNPHLKQIFGEAIPH
ncbi:MAG: hypothetical protein ACM31O_09430 [Bacteroidota bacterium]